MRIFPISYISMASLTEHSARLTPSINRKVNCDLGQMTHLYVFK